MKNFRTIRFSFFYNLVDAVKDSLIVLAEERMFSPFYTNSQLWCVLSYLNVCFLFITEFKKRDII